MESGNRAASEADPNDSPNRVRDRPVNAEIPCAFRE